MSARGSIKIGIVLFGALRAHAMAELCLRTGRDIALQRFPGTLRIPYFFAETANWQNALQGLNLFLELTFLNAHLVYQVGKTHENGDPDQRVDGGVKKREGRGPEIRKGQMRQRHADGEHQAPMQTIFPGCQHDGNQIQDGKADERTREVIEDKYKQRQQEPASDQKLLIPGRPFQCTLLAAYG